MKKAIAFLLLAFPALLLFPARASNDFSRAIAYYLIGDRDLAQKNMDAHFSKRPQPTVKVGFALLFKGEKWEATKKFSDYLESNHRSLEALTGVSLATADIKNSIAIDNLGKVVRLDPNFAPAFACLGYEYFQRGNYPAAEENFNRSLEIVAVPEFKILLAELYMRTGREQKAIDLIRPEADAAPRNYHYASMTARAALKLGDLATAARYIEQTQRARPESQEAQLLRGRLLLASGDLRKAKSLLGRLTFDSYNLEYSLTCAEVLLKLKDRDAEKYLYEVFAQNQWHPEINKLMGLFHLKGKNANIQNWIRRALLGGLTPAELQKEFPGKYSFPNYPSLAFFAARKIQWLGNGRFLVAGSQNSGQKEKLVVVDAASLKPIKSFEYEGTIQEVFPAPRQDKVIFSTTAVENEKVYVYTLVAGKNAYKLKPVVGYALSMPTILAGFSRDGSTAYVTDGSMADLAFTSPFSVAALYGRKKAIYPDLPIPVFSYDYASDRWAQVKNRDALRRIPLPVVRQYMAVADACQENSEIAKLLEKGTKISITSSEEMKIHFGASDSAFLVSLSDLKNAFQAWVYDPRDARLAQFDETMFLGDKYYSDLEVVQFRPEKGEILVRTRDKNLSLVHFNYKSLLYKKIGGSVIAAGSSPDGNTVYAINERNRQLYYSETNLEIVQLAPFSRSKIDSRSDLNAIVDCTDPNEQYFTTYNGELVKLDEERKFSSRQVSLAGALHQASADKKWAAAFINGRLFVLPWQG